MSSDILPTNTLQYFFGANCVALGKNCDKILPTRQPNPAAQNITGRKKLEWEANTTYTAAAAPPYRSRGKLSASRNRYSKRGENGKKLPTELLNYFQPV